VDDAAIIRLEVVTPDGLVYAGDVTMVVVPGVDGEFGVLARHQPIVALLAVGETRIHKPDGSHEHLATGIGYVEVLFDKVLVVVDHAELGGQIDVERAREALARAEERLKLRDDPAARAEVDFYRAEQALKRARNRLAVAAYGARAD
jgi:F-type H+-transporting ATPase subunit epsilon